MKKKIVSGAVADARADGKKIIENEHQKKAKQEKLSLKKIIGGEEGHEEKVVESEVYNENQVIAFSQVNLRYTKEYYALFEISFDVNKGETLALVGEADSGKTSILRLLTALESPTDGKVLIKNEKPTGKLFKSKVMLGYLPINPVFKENKTVFENILLVKRFRDKKQESDAAIIKNILIETELTHVENVKVKNLSYFEKQLLAIARLKIRKLDILLVDSIFEKLKEEETEKFFKLAEKIRNKDTVFIFAAENEELAKKYADRIIMLNNGSIEKAASF